LGRPQNPSARVTQDIYIHIGDDVYGRFYTPPISQEHPTTFDEWGRSTRGTGDWSRNYSDQRR